MNNKQFQFLSDIISYQSIGSNPTPHAPYGQTSREVLGYFLKYAQEQGFKTSVVEDKVGTIDIGNGSKLIGILAHLDVVPAGDGWNTDPFRLTVIDDIMYGRGIVDDKGPACASLFAMERLSHEVLPEDVTIRLILGTDEERGCDCIKTYSQIGRIPDYAITPDAEFPVIFAEKGILHIKITSKVCASKIRINGGTAPNAVPAKAYATIELPDGSVSRREFEGKSAHASRPELGINAILESIKSLSDEIIDIETSNLIEFIKFYFINSNDAAELTNCNISDISGQLTINLGMINMNSDEESITIDIRYPVTAKSKDIYDSIFEKAQAYNLNCCCVDDMKPITQNPESPLVKTLNDIWNNNMERFSGFKPEYKIQHNKPIAIGGGTYARHLPNTVAFGIQAPWQTDQCHQANESMSVSDFEAITDIIYEAILRMSAM